MKVASWSVLEKLLRPWKTVSASSYFFARGTISCLSFRCSFFKKRRRCFLTEPPLITFGSFFISSLSCPICFSNWSVIVSKPSDDSMSSGFIAWITFFSINSSYIAFMSCFNLAWYFSTDFRQVKEYLLASAWTLVPSINKASFLTKPWSVRDIVK